MRPAPLLSLLTVIAGVASSVCSSVATAQTWNPPAKSGRDYSCYGGVHGGLIMGASHITTEEGSLAYFKEQSLDVTGGLAGLQFGCDQLSGSFLYGVEAELSIPILAGADKLDFRNTYYPLRSESHAKQNSLMSLSLRVGYVEDRALFFGKVGFAYSSASYNHFYERATLNSQNGGTYNDGVTVSDGQDWFSSYESRTTRAKNSMFSALLGAGVEYMLDGAWSMKAEYNLLYAEPVDVTFKQVGAGRSYTRSTEDGALTETSTSGYSVVRRLQATRSVFKVGLNKRF